VVPVTERSLIYLPAVANGSRMDKFVKTTKPTPSGKAAPHSGKHHLRFSPYKLQEAEAERARQDWNAIGEEQRWEYLFSFNANYSMSKQSPG